MTYNPIPGHISGEKQDCKGYMHLKVHCSTAYSSRDMEGTSMSINTGLDKGGVIHIHNRILLSHQKG